MYVEILPHKLAQTLQTSKN